MFDAHGTGAARVPETDLAHPPLGQMLVERDLITEQQLQHALAEQGRTGLPIGQVLIGLSYVTAATIAQALATQEGGVVRTEFGLSTGFDTPGLVALPPVSPASPTPFAPVVVVPEPEPDLERAPEPSPERGPGLDLEREPEPELERDPEPEPEPVVEPAPLLPAASSTHARIAELVERELATATRAAAEEASAARARIAELEEEMSGLRQQAQAARGAEDLLAASNARARELEQELAAARTRAAELDRQLVALRESVEQAETVEAALASANARIAELEADVESARSASSGRIQALELERDARARDLQQTQAQLASATENLRSAYERLHRFEIAHALQQHEATARQAPPASQFTWQS